MRPNKEINPFWFPTEQVRLGPAGEMEGAREEAMGYQSGLIKK